jgi:hypothetical protein
MNTNIETLEEVAERFYSEQLKSYEDAIEPIFDNSRYLVAGFIEGAKWQEERINKNDINHLEWLYNRMVNVYNENIQLDYMIKFKEIINNLK